MLGKGAYGTVKVLRTPDKAFALKKCKLEHYCDLVAALREEAMNLKHPHIIERQWCRFWKKSFQVCMELGVHVKHAKAGRILHDIGQALYFLHSKGFIHRDVKPDNVVLVGQRFKLIDFGLTCKSGQGDVMSDYMVSRWYRPPELLRAHAKCNYDGRIDMYSLALTAYYFHHGKPLFYGDTEEILIRYTNYEPSGIYRHLICEYKDRFTSSELLSFCDVKAIEGSETPLPKREGKVEVYAELLRKGCEEEAAKMGDLVNEL